MPYTYEYPRPALTVDCVVWAPSGHSMDLLVIKRRDEPFAGQWALPGGFVDIDEEISDAAVRELVEETGCRIHSPIEVGIYGTVGRDPRGRVVSVAYTTLIDREQCDIRAGGDAAEAQWVSASIRRKYAFDHRRIIHDALQTIRRSGMISPLGVGLLKEPFSLADLRRLYEAVYGIEILPQRFSQRIRATGWLIPEAQGEQVRHKTYRFRRASLDPSNRLRVLLDLS